MTFILSLITFMPLLGALVILFIRGGDEDNISRNSRNVALYVSLGTFAVSLALWFMFDPMVAEMQFTNEPLILTDSYKALSYQVGIDGISLLFVLLTTLLTPICILASASIKKRVREYMIAFLILEAMMIGTFVATNIIQFYIFFEAVLIPMFLLIGIWGGPRRIYASFKLFLYTLLGSVLMLIAILYMVAHMGEGATGNFSDFIGLFEGQKKVQIWLWFAFFASFAVKMPMWPAHTWLPDAHVEAPTAGSVILAGVLLKFGAYGFIRILLPMLPEATLSLTWLVFALSAIAVVYTSLVALVQEDMKKLIAYSSVAHMGFVTAGIFALNPQGVEGAIFQSLSHGIVSGALFLIVGVVYDRIHSREIATYGGLVEKMPHYALIFMIFMMASIGLPGTSGFVGEFLILAGLFKVSTWATFVVALGVVLGAAYMLWLYRRIIFGALTNPKLKDIKDVLPREFLCFIPLLVLTLWMGIYPKPFLNVMHKSVDNLLYTQMKLERPEKVELKTSLHEKEDVAHGEEDEVSSLYDSETLTPSDSSEEAMAEAAH